MMMKQGWMFGAALAAGLWASPASAQTSFGQQGDFSFAIERAMGFYSGQLRQSFAPGDAVTNRTAFELGIGGGLPHPTALTRVGFDGFIIDHLSLGGGIGFASYGRDADTTVFLLAPRVGYFLGLSRHVGFWPRGGFTYYTTDGPDRWQLMLTGEAMFTFAPNEGFAFLVGPVMDLGFAGRWDPPNNRYRDRLLGISFGLVGFF